MDSKTIWDFEVLTPEGTLESLERYRGKVMLIVNTATGCGFTPQYTGLEELYRRYGDQGFVILDFPSNQFGGQAPGSDQEIQTFCELTYDTSFPRYAKLDVKGETADPLFQFLVSEAPGRLGSAIKWNFTKFLIDREGRIQRFGPTVTPEKLEKHILRSLK